MSTAAKAPDTEPYCSTSVFLAGMVTTMEYFVDMTTHVPSGMRDTTVDDIRAREAGGAPELAAEGRLLRQRPSAISPNASTIDPAIR
jgi:hypothetical protein